MTELEILTLAFAVLNFATYGLWWNKPLDVQVPFLVRDMQGDHEVYGDEGMVEGVIRCNEGWKRANEYVWEAPLNSVLHDLPEGVKSRIANVRKVPSVVRSATAADMREAIIAPFMVFFETAIGNDEIEPRSKRVGTFYSGDQ
jgi:hypothetical protein